MNTPITLAEVVAVFGKLSSGKAVGPDGIRGEFLRDAVVRVPAPDTQEDGPPRASGAVYSNQCAASGCACCDQRSIRVWKVPGVLVLCCSLGGVQEG